MLCTFKLLQAALNWQLQRGRTLSNNARRGKPALWVGSSESHGNSGLLRGQDRNLNPEPLGPKLFSHRPFFGGFQNLSPAKWQKARNLPF